MAAGSVLYYISEYKCKCFNASRGVKGGQGGGSYDFETSSAGWRSIPSVTSTLVCPLVEILPFCCRSTNQHQCHLVLGVFSQVKTDDSFQFARAVKRLRQAIEALGDATAASAAAAAGGESTISDQEEGSSLPLERKQAIILIMKEAFKSYHMAWARSSIEPAFKVVKPA